jgi:hypothetical protein
VTSLPSWAVYVVSFGTPLAAFVGVLVGDLLLRRGANELDVWRRREETMRMLRWAAEQAVSNDPARANMGVSALTALGSSELLQKADQALVESVMDAIIAGPIDEIDDEADAVVVMEIDRPTYG